MFFTTTTLSRSEFGMKAYVPYVGDEVHIPINFEGIKQSIPPHGVCEYSQLFYSYTLVRIP